MALRPAGCLAARAGPPLPAACSGRVAIAGRPAAAQAAFAQPAEGAQPVDGAQAESVPLMVAAQAASAAPPPAAEAVPVVARRAVCPAAAGRPANAGPSGGQDRYSGDRPAAAVYRCAGAAAEAVEFPALERQLVALPEPAPRVAPEGVAVRGLATSEREVSAAPRRAVAAVPDVARRAVPGARAVRAVLRRAALAWALPSSSLPAAAVGPAAPLARSGTTLQGRPGPALQKSRPLSARCRREEGSGPMSSDENSCGEKGAGPRKGPMRNGYPAPRDHGHRIVNVAAMLRFRI